MAMNYKLIFFLVLLTQPVCFCRAQVTEKVLNRQYQSWTSINTTARISTHWGFLLDVHERRNNFFKDPSFHFIRGAVNYWLTDNITFAAGYANLLLAPTTRGWKTFSDENRIYEQAQIVTKLSRISMLQRLRNEQRWQQIMVADKYSGNNKFTDRVRYLLSFTIPFSKNDKLPSLALADELCIQFGKEVIYNTFEQNRVFIGIKQKVTRKLNFDVGYMLVKQQKASGYQYDINNTFRWFFYYTPDFRKKTATATAPL